MMYTAVSLRRAGDNNVRSTSDSLSAKKRFESEGAIRLAAMEAGVGAAGEVNGLNDEGEGAGDAVDVDVDAVDSDNVEGISADVEEPDSVPAGLARARMTRLEGMVTVKRDPSESARSSLEQRIHVCDTISGVWAARSLSCIEGAEEGEDGEAREAEEDDDDDENEEDVEEVSILVPVTRRELWLPYAEGEDKGDWTADPAKNALSETGISISTGRTVGGCPRRRQGLTIHTVALFMEMVTSWWELNGLNDSEGATRWCSGDMPFAEGMKPEGMPNNPRGLLAASADVAPAGDELFAPLTAPAPAPRNPPR